MKKPYAVLTALLCLYFPGSQAQSSKYLDKNNVRARIFVDNDKFWNIGGSWSPAYEVPAGSGHHAMSANSIWIGGLDAGNQLHVAANTYKQLGFDFWTGPLDTVNIANYSAISNAPYNRLWKIDCNDVNSFVNAFNNGSVTANTYTVPNDIVSYPAKGTVNYMRNFAPFFDANNNGIYDPVAGGDYPLIKGHQQILSVFNDQRSMHGETGTAPMGVEIHERSYAFAEPLIHDSMQAINYTTFYHYTIYNRSNTNYNNVYVADWSDVDLGYFLDDYIGSDTVNDFAYCYNASSFDPGGYGSRPPVASHVLMPTDCSSDGIDNDGDMQIDEAGETFKMDFTTYYMNNINSVPPAMSNPAIGLDYYNYMKGFWKDNTPFTFGGNAYGGSQATRRVYPGDPALNTGWTEGSAANPAGDRRLIISSGPFNFPAHSKIEWSYAIVFSQDTTGGVNTISQFGSRVQRDVRNVKYYHANHTSPQCMPAIINTTGLSEEKNNTINVMAYPNPVYSKLTVDLNRTVKSTQIKLIDCLGKTVAQQNIQNSYRAEIYTEQLPSGVYLLEVNCDGQLAHSKIVKQ